MRLTSAGGVIPGRIGSRFTPGRFIVTLRTRMLRPFFFFEVAPLRYSFFFFFLRFFILVKRNELYVICLSLSSFSLSPVLYTGAQFV